MFVNVESTENLIKKYAQAHKKRDIVKKAKLKKEIMKRSDSLTLVAVRELN